MAWSHLHVDGPMARNVRDTWTMLQCLASGDTRDALAGHIDPLLRGAPEALDLSSLRMAFSSRR